MLDAAVPAKKILMVQPLFLSGSFWNYREACKIMGADYPAPPLGLMTVAAMLPQHWDIKLIDCNTGPLTDEDILWADYVFSGGMLPQREAILELCERTHGLQRPIVLGGPDISSCPELYDIADFLVIGEAEAVIGDLIAALETGEKAGTFKAPLFTVDVTTTPTPRFDLIDFSRYVHLNVQFSRGCPFLCEFCDIIELYGRKPRTKTIEQVLGELDRVYELGFRGHVDFVDDNLIGNKKAVKPFLRALIEWQRAHGYPFMLSTEASLNIADDPELLELMRDANFFVIFIGIESPDPAVLASAQKKQNTKRDIAESVQRVYDYGIFVIAGFIVGFDDESDQVADELVALIDTASIPVSMVGLLYALPNTQLTRRLEKEGRLSGDHDGLIPESAADQCIAGLNYQTTRPREAILADYRGIVERIYTPSAFIERLTKTCLKLDMSGANGVPRTWTWRNDLVGFLRFMRFSMVRDPSVRRPVLKMLATLARRNPRSLHTAVMMASLYAHFGPFARHVVTEIDQRIANESGLPVYRKDTAPAIAAKKAAPAHLGVA